MSVPEKLDSADSAKRPATVTKRRGRVRLLVPCGDRLPTGVLAKLNSTPLDVVVVPPTLGGLVMRRSDVILLGDTRRLPDLRRALQRMDALTTPVVTIGELDALAQQAADGLRFKQIPKGQSADALADAVVKAVIRYLKPLGAARRGQQTANGSAEEQGASEHGASEHGALEQALAAQSHSQPPSSTQHRLADDVPGRSETAVSPQTQMRMLAKPEPAKGSGALKPLGSKIIAAPRPVALPKEPAPPPAPPIPVTLPRDLGPPAPALTAPAVTTPVFAAPPPPPLGDFSLPVPAKLNPLPVFSVGQSRLEAALVQSAGPQVQEGRVSPRSIAPTHSIIPGTFSLQGSRWLLLDDDAARAHAAANTLANEGALLEVSRLAPSTERLDALRALAAVGALVPQGRLPELAPLLELFRTDPTLVNVHVVPVPWHELYDERSAQVDTERLKLLLLPHWQGDTRTTPAAVQLVAAARPESAARAETAEQAGAPAQPAVAAAEYDDGDLTAPFIERSALDSDKPSPSAAGNERSIAIRSRLVLAQRQLHEQLWVPGGRLAKQLWLESSSLLRRDKRVAAVAAGACVLLTVGIVLALAGGNDDETLVTEQADHGESRGQEPTPAAAETPTAGASPSLPAPPKPEASVDPMLERPAGCERWVGTEPVPRQTKQAKSAWHLARKSLMMGQIDQAQQRLCLSMHFDIRGPGTLDLVRFFFAQDDLQSATRWAQWAVQERPTDPEAKQVLADAMHMGGNEALARELLLESMNVTATEVGLIQSVARRYASAGHKALDASDPAQANRLFRRATALDPSSVAGSTGRAKIALREEQLDEALSFAQRAVQLDARDFEAQLTLGDVHAAQKEPELAKAAWANAAALRPTSREARQRLGL